MEWEIDPLFSYVEGCCVIKRENIARLRRSGHINQKQKLLCSLGLPNNEFTLSHGFLDYVHGKDLGHTASVDVLFPCRPYFDSFILWFQVWLLTHEDLLFLDDPNLKGKFDLSCQGCPKHFRYQSDKTLIKLCRCHVNQEAESQSTYSSVSQQFVSLSSKRSGILEASYYLRDALKSIENSTLLNPFEREVIKKILLTWTNSVSKELLGFFFGPRNDQILMASPPSEEDMIDQPVYMNSLITLEKLDSSGVGVYLKPHAMLPSQSLLMSIDEHEVIHLYKVLETPKFESVAWYLMCSGTDFSTEDVILLLYLIWDRYCNPKSLHHAYYNSLPSFDNEANHNLLLAPMDVIHFMDIPILYEIRASCDRKLSLLYDFCIQTLSSKFSDLINPLYFTWERFLWARWLIDTRAFLLQIPPSDDMLARLETLSQTVESTRDTSDTPMKDLVAFPERLTALLPGADNFNHHRLVGCCRLPQFNMSLRRFEIRNDFPISNPTSSPVELYMTYGPFESWELLMYYGFCPSRASMSESLMTAQYQRLFKTNTDTLNVDVVLEESSCVTSPCSLEKKIMDPYCLRDKDFGYPAVTTGFSNLVIKHFGSLDAGLCTLLEPLVEETVKKIQFVKDQKILPSKDQLSWIPSWGDRLCDFFSSRLSFLLKHMGVTLPLDASPQEITE